MMINKYVVTAAIIYEKLNESTDINLFQIFALKIIIIYRCNQFIIHIKEASRCKIISAMHYFQGKNLNVQIKTAIR